MRDLHNSPPTHFGQAVVAPMGPKDKQLGISPIEYRISYINNLSFPVVIAQRNGLKFTIPKQYSFTTNTLRISVEIHIHSSARMDIQKTLSAVNETSPQELQVLKNALSYQMESNALGAATLFIDYPITLETLRNNGGTIYFHELDLVISLEEYDKVQPHPFSHEGMKLNLIVTNESNAGFNWSIDIVDNLNRYGPRFISICNKVQKINTIKDNTRKDGIYIISKDPVISEIDNTSTNAIYFELTKEVESELGLFKTYEEANNHFNNIISKRSLEEAELVRETAKSKLSAQITKSEAEIQQLIMADRMAEREREREERKNADIEHLRRLEMDREKYKNEIEILRGKEEHRLKMEREYVKDHYEDRSYVRKDSSEGLKMLPTIAMGIGALFIAFNAFNK